MVGAAATWLDSGQHSEKKKTQGEGCGFKTQQLTEPFLCEGSSHNLCKVIGGQLVVCVCAGVYAKLVICPCCLPCQMGQATGPVCVDG